MPHSICFSDGSSGPLSQTLISPKVFPQQGSVEWGGLLSSIFSASVGVLARYAASGVDSYTAIVAQAICNNFKLAPIGRKHVEEAMTNLHSFGSLGNVLWFGFGIKHLVRSLAATEQGAACLALCGALSECYHGAISAEIFSEMANYSEAPEELKPSVQQWSALVKACAGVFACTAFPTRVAFFMELCPEFPGQPLQPRQVASLESIAEALLAVGKVSRGELASVTIMGRADAGYLAALAEWFFGLSIQVMDGTGNLLYSNIESTTVRVQLLIMFIDQPTPHASPTNQQLQLCTIGKTYVLKDCDELLRLDEYGAQEIARGGRISWEKVLSSTFGSDFQKLLTTPRAFGLAVGNAARIFKAITLMEDDVPLQYSHWNRTYCDLSYGAGFIENITCWFPELARLRSHMDEGVRVSYAHAKTMYEANLSQIKATCKCRLCLGGVDFVDVEGEIGYDDDRYCCAVLVDTIIDIARCLSTTTVPDTLYPTRGGFEIWYNRHLNMRLDNEWVSDRFKELGAIVFSLDMPAATGDENEPNNMEKSSFRALELFAGIAIQSRNIPHVSALCESGLCAYLNILCDLSDTDQSLGQISITPGRIELNSKAHDSLEDPVFSSVLQSQQLRLDGSQNLRLDRSQALSSNYDNVSIVVKEKAAALQIMFEFKDTKTNITEISSVGPRRLADTLMSSRGLVSCRKKKCPPVEAMPTLQNISQTHQQVQLHGKEIEIFRGDKLSRCAAIRAYIEYGFILVVDHECFDCCVRTILAAEEVRKALVIFAPGVRSKF